MAKYKIAGTLAATIVALTPTESRGDCSGCGGSILVGMFSPFVITTEPGETFEDIAVLAYDDPTEWVKIWEYNNPNSDWWLHRYNRDDVVGKLSLNYNSDVARAFPEKTTLVIDFSETELYYFIMEHPEREIKDWSSYNNILPQ